MSVLSALTGMSGTLLGILLIVVAIVVGIGMAAAYVRRQERAGRQQAQAEAAIHTQETIINARDTRAKVDADLADVGAAARRRRLHTWVRKPPAD